jgi:superfamily II DNA or RNA helicase
MNMPARPVVTTAGRLLFEKGFTRVRVADEMQAEIEVLDGPGYLVMGTRHVPEGEAVSWRCTCDAYRRAFSCAHLVAAELAARRDRRFFPPRWLRHLRALLRPGRPGVGLPTGHEVCYLIDVPTSDLVKRPALAVGARRRKRTGEWGVARPLRDLDPETLEDLTDRRLSALLGGTPPLHTGPWHAPGRTLAAELLPALCATGRLLRHNVDEDLENRPLSFDDGPPWTPLLRLQRTERGYGLEGEIRRGEERLDACEAWLLTEGFLFQDDRVSRLLDQGLVPLLEHQALQGGIDAPEAEGEELALELLRQGVEVELPEELAIEAVRVKPRPRLRITAGTSRLLGAHLSFDYDDVTVPASKPGSTVPVGERRLVFRDLAAERATFDRLLELGFRLPPPALPGRADLALPAGKLPMVVQALLPAGFLVEAEGRLYRQPTRVAVKVKSGLDWFGLEGSVRFDSGEATLASVLEALRKGENVVALGDGSFGVLPEEWLARHRALLELGEPDEGGLRFRRSQVSVLDALLASQDESEADLDFGHARARLRAFEGIRPADPPPSFVGTLREYQREGLGWMRFLEELGFGGCLADDMGLGKTVQLLAHLAERPRRPSLVVAPRSLLFNWESEARHFTPQLRVLVHAGVDRIRDAAALREADLVVTTYGVLRRDIEVLRQLRFDYAVLDEAQAIKNAGTEAAKAARLLQADHRLALTGTPVENHLGDLWSLFEFLNPGLLGRSSAFAAAGAGRAEIDAEGRAQLGRVLRPFLLRRTKEKVAPELPPRQEETLLVELPPAQRAVYDTIRHHYRERALDPVRKGGVKRSALIVLEALLRLRQAACHPVLVDPAQAGAGSAKLHALLPQLEEVLEGGHKALVFSQFVSFLSLLRHQLDAKHTTYAYLDGQTQNREAVVRRFQEDPSCGLFLISLKAGGFGLNLTAADYVFLLDPWWNPAVEAQAIDRTHRIGQQRPVFAYRLVAKDTVEEKILALQQSKRDLADAIVAADDRLLSSLTADDLDALLS